MEKKYLLLRKCEEPTAIKLSLYYQGDMDPEAYLIEKDILAGLFDSSSLSVYLVECGYIKSMFRDFAEALARYYELAINWKAVETYVHPRIFMWDKRWAEGVQYPL